MGLSSTNTPPVCLNVTGEGTTGHNRCCRKYVHRFVLVKKQRGSRNPSVGVGILFNQPFNVYFRRNVIRQCIPFGFACRNDVGRLRELGVGVQEAGRHYTGTLRNHREPAAG